MAALDIVLRSQELPAWERGTRLSAVAIGGGGPVATALVAVQRLGVPAGFVGTYGSDRLGQIKRETLVEHGVDVSRALQRPGPENQVVLVNVHEATGERVFSGLSGPGSPPLAVGELDRNYITGAELLHLDGYHAEAALQAARWMRAAGKTVMLDGSSTRGPLSAEMRALVQEANILICGSGFGAALTGLADLWAAGAAILELGPHTVVQTEGKHGSYTVTRRERFHTPAFDVDVVDTTGAGDVFHGAYIVALLRGWDLRTAALFSSAVSAIKCTQLGGRPGIPTLEEALAFLRERGIQIAEKPDVTRINPT
jgi:sugar/nucleoside kinase (ribokinase family)